MKRRASIIISGKVQGVFYRSNAKRKAEGLNLTGWAKNRSDGKVEILAEGEEEGLKEFIKWCYNGSEGARVEGVEIKWKDIEKGKFERFEIVC